MRTASFALALWIAAQAAPAAPGGSEAKLLEGKGPVYPAAEKQAGHEGRVALSFRVLATGAIADLRVKKSSGFPALDAAALETVRAWKFAPATDADGQAIEANVDQVVEFELDEDPMAFLAKPCAKVVEEVAALRSARADAQLREANTFRKTGGVMYLVISGRPVAEQADIMVRLPAFYEAVYADCRQAPDTVYEVAMKRHFDVLGLRGRGAK